MPEPILIATHARSGSTLLRYILDTHPDISAPGESPLGALCSTVIDFAAQLPDEDGRRGGAASDAFIAGGRALVDDAMTTHAVRRGKRIWCVKSLTIAERLPDVLQVFPEARYLCLYRHGMDVVASSLEAARWGYGKFGFRKYIMERPENVVAAVAQSWIDRTTHMLDLERAATHSTFRVRYEDLVTDPDYTITRILRFLGLRHSPHVVAAMAAGALRDGHDGGHGDFKVAFTSEVNADSIGRGHIVPVTSIDPDQLPVMNNLLGELGYEPIDKEWNISPGTGMAARPGLAEQVAGAMAEIIKPRLATLTQSRDGVPAPPLRLDIAYPDGLVEHWRADSAQGTLAPDPAPDNDLPGYRMRAESFLELASGTIPLAQAVATAVVGRGKRAQGREIDRLAGHLFNSGPVSAAPKPAWSA
jgi:hypothetical protein